MNSDLVTTERLTELEARRLVDEIKADISAVGGKLLELYEGEGWLVLGYSNWRECVMNEFDFQKSHVYELLNFARVERNLSANGGNYPMPANERQARPLASLPPEQQVQAWTTALETAPNGKPTAAHIERTVQDYHRLRDNRRSQVQDIYTPLPSDACQTPAYAIDPLLRYLQEGWNIWEPAAGEGYLEGALYDSGFSVVSGDLITGQNFFDYEPERWDCLVTNPPFSTHSLWLKRCYELGKPFALLMKVDILGNKGEQEMFDQFGIEVIFVSPRINFKMPRLGWGDGDHKSSATFSTAWFTWGLHIGQQMTFAKVVPDAATN